jgi:hypothetical protein
LIDEKTYSFLQEVGEHEKRETNTDTDAGRVVKEDIAAQRGSVDEQQEPADSHSDLKNDLIFSYQRVNEINDRI